jgi:hypothetical protein
MTAEHLDIARGWRDVLAEAGLDSLRSLLELESGRLLSSHRRGWVRQVHLGDGREVFVKTSLHTRPKQILADLSRLRRPVGLTEKERRGIALVRELGIAAPEVIAAGEQRRWGLPVRGVIVLGPLAGQTLGEYLQGTIDASVRRATLVEVGRALAALRNAGLYWPDVRAKHVYVDDAGGIGLLDLERLDRATIRTTRRWPRQLDRLCKELAEAAALESDDLAALIDAFRGVIADGQPQTAGL